MKRGLQIAIACGLLPLGIVGCRTAPIYNVSSSPLVYDETATLEDVSEAIWRAGRKLGWEMEAIRPGEMEGTLRIRHHIAVVTVTYNTRSFSIRYKQSENLLHDGASIHRRYNLWIRKLDARIRNEPLRL